MGSGPGLLQILCVASGPLWTSPSLCTANELRTLPLGVLGTTGRVYMLGDTGWAVGRRAWGFRARWLGSGLYLHTAFCISPFSFQSVQCV